MDLNDSIITGTQEKITQAAIAETSCRIYPKNTVLIAMYGGFKQIGRTGILGIKAATNQAISALLPDPRVHPRFLNFVLIYLRPRWKAVASSSRKDPNITKGDVKQFRIVLPPVREQVEIANVLEQLNDLQASARESYGRLSEAKRLVLQALL